MHMENITSGELKHPHALSVEPSRSAAACCPYKHTSQTTVIYTSTMRCSTLMFCQ